MGLAQKRITAEYQATPFVEWKKKFDAICGFEMPMDVKWDTMQSEEYTNRDQYFEWYDKVYFAPLTETFISLCSDAMGKEAVKGGVKKIVIDGSDGSSYRHSTFDGGVLTIRHKFSTNVDEGRERTKGWREMIEAKL